MAALVFREASVMPDLCTASLRSLLVSIEGDEKSSSCKITLNFTQYSVSIKPKNANTKEECTDFFSLILIVTHKIGSCSVNSHGGHNSVHCYTTLQPSCYYVVTIVVDL